MVASFASTVFQVLSAIFPSKKGDFRLPGRCGRAVGCGDLLQNVPKPSRLLPPHRKRFPSLASLVFEQGRLRGRFPKRLKPLQTDIKKLGSFVFLSFSNRKFGSLGTTPCAKLAPRVQHLRRRDDPSASPRNIGNLSLSAFGPRSLARRTAPTKLSLSPTREEETEQQLFLRKS